MLAQHARRWNRGVRRDRRENCALRSLRVSAVSSFVMCVSAARVGAAAAHLHQRHRADHLEPLRVVPSARRDRPLQPDHLRRCAAARDADRDGDRAAHHAAVEAGRGQGRLSERAPPDRCRAADRCSSGSRTARPRAIARRCRRMPNWSDGWQLGHTRSHRPHAGAHHACRPTAPTCSARS